MNLLCQTRKDRARWLRLGLMVVLAMGLSACIAGQVPMATPAAEDASAAGTPGVITTTAEIADVDALPQDQTTGPVRLEIPAIDLDVPVIAMGWRVEVVDGARTTIWDMPDEEAGWHMNSAGAGAAGNTIISGRQVGGAAVFAPLALGAVTEGQEIFLTDGDGIRFLYRVSEVTEPLPITGATPEEEAQAAAYLEPTDTARLTLVTGWPEFTTTHRIFVIAEFVGVERE